MNKSAYWIGGFIFFLFVGVSLLTEKDHHITKHEQGFVSMWEMIDGWYVTEFEILGKDVSGKAVTTRMILKDGVWQTAHAQGYIDTNPASVDKKIAFMSKARIDRCFSVEVGAFRQYGLEEPLVTLKATGSRSRQTIDFGFQTPDGFGRYISVGGSPEVCVISRYHYENLVGLARAGSELSESELRL